MERFPVIKLDRIIADTIWIYAAYRIFKASAKRQILLIPVRAYKKGHIHRPDSPL